MDRTCISSVFVVMSHVTTAAIRRGMILRFSRLDWIRCDWKSNTVRAMRNKLHQLRNFKAILENTLDKSEFEISKLQASPLKPFNRTIHPECVHACVELISAFPRMWLKELKTLST
eukprot:912601-Pyramimonas_sp.AAC.1